MKRTTIIAALLLAGTTVFATGTEKAEEPSSSFAIANNSLNQFKLVYLEKEEGMVKVYLKDERGQILHRASVKNVEGFSQNFDLSELPAGDYTFKVTNPDGSITKEKVHVEAPKKEANFNANVLNVNDDKKFRLAVLNKDDRALNTSISIYNETGDIIHSETITNLVGFRKMYDLSKVKNDAFIFEIENSTGSKYYKTK